MYQILYNLIGYPCEAGSQEAMALYFLCCALVLILTGVFTDMLYRVFSHFWRG